MNVRTVRSVPILPAVGSIPAGLHLYPVIADGAKTERDLRAFCDERRHGARCDGRAHGKRDCEFGLRNCPFIVE